MKKLIGIGLLCVISSVAHAGSQQNKMKVCNATAKEKGLKGDERKAFMKDCLSRKAEGSADHAAAAATDKKAAQ